MLSRLNQFIARVRIETSFVDKLQLFGVTATIASLVFVYFQLRENTNTNRVAIRTQLYQTEWSMSADENADGGQALSTIWALVPPNIRREKYVATLLGLITEDQRSLQSKNAGELYHSMFDAATFADKTRRESTRDLRRLFLYVQTNFYHVHSAYDYRKDSILAQGEWLTWKGLLRETHVHPMLLTVIWHGYQNRYFSRGYARFLQQELCADTTPTDVVDAEEVKRDCDFVRYYYPEMMKHEWPDSLPDY